MQQSFNFTLLFEVPQSQIHEVNGNDSKVLEKGVLCVYELREKNMTILKLNKWQYSLAQNIPVMTQQRDRQIYILPSINKNYFGVAMAPNVAPQLIDCLQSVFSNNANFVMSAPESVKQPPKSSEQSTSSQIGNFLSKGGDMIRQGLIVGATILSQGIMKGGQFIKTKITQRENVQVKPETMLKVKAAKTTSNAMLTYTKNQVEGLVNVAKIVGTQVSNSIEKSETGQKITQHQHYDDVKKVAQGTVHAVAAVYDGMFQAMCVIGRGFASTTTDVVNYKYGNAAAEVTQDSLDAVGNVGALTRVYQDTAVQTIQEETQDQSQPSGNYPPGSYPPNSYPPNSYPPNGYGPPPPNNPYY